MDRITDATGVVLAGGKSRRMGQDKRLIDIGGQSMLSRIVNIYRPIFEEIIVVIATPDPSVNVSGVRVVSDLIPNGGSLGGLYTGLSASATPWVFAAACDMPCLNPAVVHALLRHRSEGVDAIVPRVLNRLQPMHGVYHARCLPHFQAVLLSGRFAIHEALSIPSIRISIIEEDKLRRVDSRLLSFLNVNTPADLEFARKLITEGPADESHGP